MHSSVEALDHAMGLERVGRCPAVLRLQRAAGLFEGLGCEARAAVVEHMSDPEGGPVSEDVLCICSEKGCDLPM